MITILANAHKIIHEAEKRVTNPLIDVTIAI
jgi:hypothetical protein